MEKYLSRLKNSIDKFEAEAGSLASINQLMASVQKLAAEIQREHNSLTQSGARLEELRAQVAKDCAEILKYAAAEKAAREKFLQDIHALVVNDTTRAVSGLTDSFAAAQQNLTAGTEKFSSLVENEAAANEKFHAEISSALTSYIAEEQKSRRELVGKIHDTVTADARKIIVELSAPLNQSVENLGKISAQLTNLIDTLSQKIAVSNGSTLLRINSLEQKIQDTGDRLEHSIDALDQKISALNEKLGRSRLLRF